MHPKRLKSVLVNRYGYQTLSSQDILAITKTQENEDLKASIPKAQLSVGEN